MTMCWEAPEGSVSAAGGWLKITVHRQDRPGNSSGVYIGSASSKYLNGKHFELEILDLN